MIIPVVGNYGAGKTTAVRKVMERFEEHKHVEEDNDVIGTIVTVDQHRKMFVVGDYDRKFGGTDMLRTAKRAEELIRRYAKAQWIVLFEGIRIQRQLAKLEKDFTVHPFLLDMTIRDAIKSVKSRGRSNPMPDQWIKDEQARITKMVHRWEDNGVRFEIVDRTDVVDSIYNFIMK